MHNFTPVAVSA